jgi:hypothetical protein
MSRTNDTSTAAAAVTTASEKKNERILSIDAAHSVLFAPKVHTTTSDGGCVSKTVMEPTQQTSLRLATAGNDGVRVSVNDAITLLLLLCLAIIAHHHGCMGIDMVICIIGS